MASEAEDDNNVTMTMGEIVFNVAGVAHFQQFSDGGRFIILLSAEDVPGTQVSNSDLAWIKAKRYRRHLALVDPEHT
jgi:hypothetical protein